MNDYKAHADMRDTARVMAADRARIAVQREQLARYAEIKASRKVGVVARIVAWIKGITA